VGENMDTIQKNTKANKTLVRRLVWKWIQYMLMSHYQKAGQKHSIQTENRSFEYVAKFKYFGTLTDKNCIHKETTSRLNLWNACYHLVQSSVFLPAL
jgi:hypothetical protein